MHCSHTDFVTAIVFHPKDDRYFLSGSMDGKLRLWNIPDKKVAHWVDPPPPPAPPGISASAASRTGGHQKCLITCANFCMDGGQRAVVGTYDGRVIFYTSDVSTGRIVCRAWLVSEGRRMMDLIRSWEEPCSPC